MTNIFEKIIFHFSRIPEYLIKHPKRIFDYCYLRWHGVETEYGFVELKGLPIIYKHAGSRIVLGKGCTLVSKSKYNVAGINHPVILATLTSAAVIEIGKVGISGSSVCAAKKITIKDYSGLGANSHVYDTDFHPIDPDLRKNQKSFLDADAEDVFIGENVWIASNVIILKGVTISDQAIIGAGSIVTGDVPPNTIFAGNPARKIKDL